MTSITDTLKERGVVYGEFCTQAQVVQALKQAMRNSRGGAGWNNLTAPMQESLDMIAHKIGRILNGDPSYKDSWVDIEGYAHLVSEQLSDSITIQDREQEDRFPG